MFSLKHEGLKQFGINALTLLSGSAFASLLGLLSIAITTRILSVEGFGQLVLITSYAVLIDLVVNFQSWQAVIKYGSAINKDKNSIQFKKLLKFGALLDFTTALLGVIVANAILFLVVLNLDWERELVFIAAIYSCVLIFHLSGTPIAVLRLFRKYKLSAAQEASSAIFKLCGVCIVYALDGGLIHCLLVWGGADILGQLILICLAKRVLNERNITNISKVGLNGFTQDFDGIIKFVLTTNLHSSVKSGLKEIDIFVVGFLLGTAESGFFKIVKQIGQISGKVVSPLYQAVYPELANTVVEKDRSSFFLFLRKPMLYVFITFLVVILVFGLIGDQFIMLFFGDAFIVAYAPAVVYMFGVLIAATTFTFQPAALALGVPGHSLKILIISSLFYLTALYYLTELFGLIGASFSFVCFYIIWALLMSVMLRLTTSKVFAVQECKSG